MKYILALCLFFSSVSLFAIDGIFAGLGAETNANTREGAAFGGGISAGLNLNTNIALGIKTSFNGNFDTVAALESAAFFRWYLPLPIRGLFAQAEAGGIFFFEEGESFPAFLGGITAGWRFNLQKNFYIEPTVRGGFPFAWGVGFNAGYRFKVKSKSEKVEMDNEQLEISNEQVEEVRQREIMAAQINAILEERHIADTTAEVTDEGVKITLSNIQFAADSAVLPAAERDKIQQIANILNAVPARNILIAGHTADTGNRTGELNISRARAQSVAYYLISLGARTSDEITVFGFGADYPVANNSTAQGMAANRRVEIIILGN